MLTASPLYRILHPSRTVNPQGPDDLSITHLEKTPFFTRADMRYVKATSLRVQNYICCCRL